MSAASTLEWKPTRCFHAINILLFVVAAFTSTADCQIQSRQTLIYDNYARPAVGVDELFRRRGFIAANHVVRTKDGYLLELTHGENPLFQGKNKTRRAAPCKYPILFVHGTFSAASIWLSFSANAMPKDLTNVDVEGSSEEQLHLLFGGEPSARSFPILMLNFGCDVWIVNRRTTIRSILLYKKELAKKRAAPLKSSGSFDEPQAGTVFDVIKPILNLPFALVSFGNTLPETEISWDRKYWNFSLDEQAEFDLTATVDFVLDLTDSEKLIIFAHSSGGAITLMKLSSTPEFADKGKCRKPPSILFAFETGS